MTAQLPQSTTAADMIAMLRRHYLPDPRVPAGVFAPEIQTPDGTRRADLIWMPTTIAGGAARGNKRIELWGHEIKVTRQDVQVELADPTKAEAWAQYCTRWWLVVLSPRLIEGLDIPAAWGVLAPPTGRRTRSLTVVQPAPELIPTNQADALERIARWQLYKHRDIEAAAEQKIRYANQENEHLRNRLAHAEATSQPADPAGNSSLVVNVLAALRQQGYRTPWSVPEPQHVEAIVRSIVATEETIDLAQQARTRIENLVQQVQAVAEPFRNALRPLRELAQQARTLERDAS